MAPGIAVGLMRAVVVEDRLAVVVQQEVAVLLVLNDHGHIANHRMVVVVVRLVPVVAGVVVALRLPMPCSIY